MGMFTNYETLQDEYIPSNTKPDCPKPPNPKLEPLIPKKPYEEFNEEGQLIGYWWNYGDIVTLEFDIDGEVTIEDDAILYTASGEGPTTNTKGRVGQKAYNLYYKISDNEVVDMKSWTCVGRDTQTLAYLWNEDEKFSPPEEGQRDVYITAQDFLSDKQITVQLYNFRHELITSKLFNGTTEVRFDIDKKLSDSLVKGVYYCSLTVWNQDETYNQTIFQQEETTLIVK